MDAEDLFITGLVIVSWCLGSVYGSTLGWAVFGAGLIAVAMFKYLNGDRE